jgi:hypothetical protein
MAFAIAQPSWKWQRATSRWVLRTICAALFSSFRSLPVRPVGLLSRTSVDYAMRPASLRTVLADWIGARLIGYQVARNAEPSHA